MILKRFLDKIFTIYCHLTILIILIPLASIVYSVVREGVGVVSLRFLTSLPTPPGVPGGGVAHAIEGTILLTILTMAMSLPVGILAAVYISEYGRNSWIANFVRGCVDVLAGTPSIVAGIFGYSLIVVRFGFSVIAGAVALSLIAVPLIVVYSESALRMVPEDVREGGLALGLRRWLVTLFIVMRAALPAILAGSLLAMARIMGETAPLIFTAFGSNDFARSIFEPCSALPLLIWIYATSPFREWHRQAWGAAFILMIIVLAINLIARRILGERR